MAKPLGAAVAVRIEPLSEVARTTKGALQVMAAELPVLPLAPRFAVIFGTVPTEQLLAIDPWAVMVTLSARAAPGRVPAARTNNAIAAPTLGRPDPHSIPTLLPRLARANH